MKSNKHKVLVTGAAGYVGAMLAKKIAEREDVLRVVALDKEPMPELLQELENLTYLQQNTAGDWQALASEYAPDIVVHAAWHIRPMYGDRETTWKWNIDGSDAVFDFCLENGFVKKLVHFSTIASYGAFADNTVDKVFTENDSFRESPYLYAEEKRIAENHLRQKFELLCAERPELQVAILRPASITGPRGRFMRKKFGLQSALAGKLLAFVPVTKNWLRQFIHEDDVVAIVEHLAFTEAQKEPLDTFIICPPGDVVLGRDMARIVGKRAITLPAFVIRFGFFLAWHLSLGRIPTGLGAWRGYSYPIRVDGGKLSRESGYTYRYSGTDAITNTNGAYEYAVPPLLRKTIHERTK